MDERPGRICGCQKRTKKSHILAPAETIPDKEAAARQKIFGVFTKYQHLHKFMFSQSNFTPLWDCDVLITIHVCCEVFSGGR